MASAIAEHNRAARETRKRIGYCELRDFLMNLRLMGRVRNIHCRVKTAGLLTASLKKATRSHIECTARKPGQLHEVRLDYNNTGPISDC